jgi:hypothetical protein
METRLRGAAVVLGMAALPDVIGIAGDSSAATARIHQHAAVSAATLSQSATVSHSYLKEPNPMPLGMVGNANAASIRADKTAKQYAYPKMHGSISRDELGSACVGFTGKATLAHRSGFLNARALITPATDGNAIRGTAGR